MLSGWMSRNSCCIITSFWVTLTLTDDGILPLALGWHCLLSAFTVFPAASIAMISLGGRRNACFVLGTTPSGASLVGQGWWLKSQFNWKATELIDLGAGTQQSWQVGCVANCIQIHLNNFMHLHVHTSRQPLGFGIHQHIELVPASSDWCCYMYM